MSQGNALPGDRVLAIEIYIIMSRRLMFLHYILNEDKKSLIYRCLEAQMRNPVRNDWILTVWEDFEELDIALDIETISTLSIGCYRKFLFKKIEDRVLHYLNEMKAGSCTT